MRQSEYFDVCVIGGGLAGLSAAAELAHDHRVLLLEQEPHFAYHSTGRSAALYAASYGNPAVRALTRASRSFYLDGSGEAPLTSPRGVLFAAGATQLPTLEALFRQLHDAAPEIEQCSAAAAMARCPALRESRLAGAVYDPTAHDIDVARTVDCYVRRLRSRGVVQRRDAETLELTRADGRWTVRTPSETYSTAIVVNAAGAWADDIARRAGLPPCGLEPRRRTAVRVPSGDWQVANWPCVIDVDEQWYFRPDAGELLISPADETPVPPCDAQPDDHDVALAIERVESATTLTIDRPLSAWAGLRTFAPDRSPVVGFDPLEESFFWLAGQGGYGIQMAPALARLTAALLSRRRVPDELACEGIDAAVLSPRRFVRALEG